MATNSTFGVSAVLGAVFYILGYIVLALLVVILLIWIFLLWGFIRENQRKINNTKRMNAPESYGEIAVVKCNNIKLRLMIVLLIFELISCLVMASSLLGNELESEVDTFNRTTMCQSWAMNLECRLLFDAIAINTLLLCVGGFTATLPLYISEKFMNQNRTTRVIRYMTAFILIQVLICLPLDLSSYKFFAVYFYAVFNTVNYVLLLKGCLRLRQLLRWRRQDYNFTRYQALYQKIENRYKWQVYMLMVTYSLIILIFNFNLVVRDGIFLPTHLFSGTQNIIFEQVFQVLRYLEGFIWIMYSLIFYTTVLISFLISKSKSPKYTRYHVCYPSNTTHQPLLLRGVK